MAAGRHFENLIWCYNYDGGGSIWIKFGRLIQNEMLMLTSRSKLKPEVEFQYGDRLILETGSSNISALDWAISSKFCVQIDFDLLERLLSLNPKPELDIRFYGRPLENSIWRHKPMQNDTPITKNWSKLKPEVEFRRIWYSGRLFFETGCSYISAVDCDTLSKWWITVVSVSLSSAGAWSMGSITVVIGVSETLMTSFIPPHSGNDWSSSSSS